MTEPAHGRARIRALFLRSLGVVFAIAFASLHLQIPVLLGDRGLLPAREYVDLLRSFVDWHEAPTVFRWIGAEEATLLATSAAGVALSLLLVAGIAPRLVLAALWALYLSFANVGQSFLSFQWDNLLLETAFFSWFVAPWGLLPGRPRGSRRLPAPHPAAVFLLQWLLVRLNLESGLAKWLGGDPVWRDGTAMASYYETAPLPTWVGWYCHQLPLPVHQAASYLTYVAEIGLPLALVGPRRLRIWAFGGMVALQFGISLTANYGFFNLLSAALCLWMLDDSHLEAAARRVRRTTNRAGAIPPSAEEEPRGPRTTPPEPLAAPSPERIEGGTKAPATRAPDERARGARAPVARTSAWVGAAVLAAVSIVPFSPFVVGMSGAAIDALAPAIEPLTAFRSMNAYHLFVDMTLVRDDVVIEGSDDGTTWRTYEFRWKPGDPLRAPSFVAPHQPRVDFQLWFLFLGRERRARYFETLLLRLLQDPPAVASLFAVNPFPKSPPRWLRWSRYRYRFSDRDVRRATGAWWIRDLLSTSDPIALSSLRGR